MLDTLTPREEAKVAAHALPGIEMNTDHTLEEVGKQFSVTRERIRQIEARRTAQVASPWTVWEQSSVRGEPAVANLTPVAAHLSAEMEARSDAIISTACGTLVVGWSRGLA